MTRDQKLALRSSGRRGAFFGQRCVASIGRLHGRL